MADFANTLLFRQLMREQDQMRAQKAEADAAAAMATQRTMAMDQQGRQDFDQIRGTAFKAGSVGLGVENDDPAISEMAQIGAAGLERELQREAAERAAGLQKVEMTTGARRYGADVGYAGRVLGANTSRANTQDRVDAQRDLSADRLDVQQSEGRLGRDAAYARTDRMARALEGYRNSMLQLRTTQGERDTLNADYRAVVAEYDKLVGQLEQSQRGEMLFGMNPIVERQQIEARLETLGAYLEDATAQIHSRLGAPRPTPGTVDLTRTDDSRRGMPPPTGVPPSGGAPPSPGMETPEERVERLLNEAEARAGR